MMNNRIVGIYPFRSKIKICPRTSRRGEGRNPIFGWIKCILCLGLILAVAVSTVDAGVDAPAVSVIDITVDATRNAGKLVSIIMDGRTHYKLVDELPDRLIVELSEVGLSNELRSRDATIQLENGPVSSIYANDDQNMRRVYVYIELRGEIEYTDKSASSPDKVRLEINPSSAGTRHYSMENRLPSRTRESTSNLERGNASAREAETPLLRPSMRRNYRDSGTSSQNYRSGNRIASITDVYVEDIGGGKIDLVIEADAPIYPRISEDRSGLLIRISDAMVAWADVEATPRGRSNRIGGITGQMERRSMLGQSRRAGSRQLINPSSNGKISMRDGKISMRRRLSDGNPQGRDVALSNPPVFASKILPVNRGAIRQITVSQKSNNPALVEIVVDEEYLTEYRNIPQKDPNVVIYEIDTSRQKANRRIISSATRRENPDNGGITGRIKGDTIMLRVGHSFTLETGGLEDGDTISIGNPKVTGVVSNNSGDLVINGLSRGVTNLDIWSRRLGEIGNYQVYVYDDKEWLENEILNAIGGQVLVRALNGTVFLEGTVETGEDKEKAQAIAQALSIDDGTVINHLKVSNPFNDDIARQIELILDDNNLSDVQVIASSDRIILKGAVPNEDGSRYAESIAATYGTVVNTLKVALPAELAAEIESVIGMPKVRVRVANGSTAILRGIVTSETDKHNAEEIAKSYVPKVINSLEVKSARLSAEDIVSLIDFPNITVRWSELGDMLYLNGTVDKQFDADFAKRRAEQIAGKNNVISNIRVISQDQVNIKVKVIEISKTVMSTIGIDWPRQVSFAESFVPTNLGKMGRPIRLTALNATINALYQDGQARVLLNNNLTVRSGEEANLLAGGQIPLFGELVNQQGFSRAVFGQEMLEYGAKLNIIPTVDSDGIINVKLTSAVSGLNSTTFQTPSGPVSTLSANTINTTLPMKSGETRVIGGLMQQRESEHKNRVPLLGHIPLLGRLFTTTQKEKSESEVVFILTATIVTDMGMNGHLAPLDQNPPENKSQFDESLRIPGNQNMEERKPFKWQ